MSVTTPQNWLNGYTARLRPALQGAARVTAIFATAILQRLDVIADALEADTHVRRLVQPMLFAGGDTKTLEVPPGERWTLALIAVNCTAPPATVTLRSGGMLRYIRAFATSDTDGPNAMLSAGPGAPLEVSSTTAAEVTLHIDVLERGHPLNARNAGDRLPVGLSSNSVALEIGRHFPDAIRHLDTGHDRE